MTMQDEELIERQPVSYHDTIGFLETAFRNIEFDAPMSNDDIEDVRQALNSVVAKRVAALAASPSPEISEPTKRMEKILDAPFVRRDASPTSLQNPQTSAPVVGDEGRREAGEADILNLADKAVTWALDSFGGYSTEEVDAGIHYMQARGKDRWSMQAQMDHPECFGCEGTMFTADDEPCPLCTPIEHAPIARVECVETVPIDHPFSDEATPPIWRVVVGEYCADFDYEQAARNFADAINEGASHAK